MALDTDAKRFSALNVGSPWRGIGYFPTGTVDAAERLAIAFLYSGIAAEAPVEIPDVEGETQAAGTATLEGSGFVVVVETAYSPTVPVGEIISQEPAGGEFASAGSTITITVSLGPEPAPPPSTIGGGDDAPPRKQKDYRPGLDQKRLREKQELRELLERAAGLLDEAEEVAEPTEVEQQPQIAPTVQSHVADLREQLDGLKVAVDREALTAEIESSRARLDGLIAKAIDDLIVQVEAVIQDLMDEIAEDSER